MTFKLPFIIGNTPIIDLDYFSSDNIKIFAKLEGHNPGGSIKDRIAFFMLKDALLKGLIDPSKGIVEPTSGNTGIGLAMLCAYWNIPCKLVMPENMSEERKRLLKFYGAELILTPSEQGMKGAIETAKQLVKEEGLYMPDQFNNPLNVKAHIFTTAFEIVNQLKDKKLDYFVAGVGTAGTITGVGRVLKDYYLDCKVVAVEPKRSAVLSGRSAGSHKIQGIGAGFVPPLYDKSVVDNIVAVDDEEAIDVAKLIALKQGVSVGISSGAALCAALKVKKQLILSNYSNINILVIFPDRADKYISVLC